MTMPLQSSKWMVLMATIWIQAISGTNFDFPSYSTQLKSVLEISQVKLNYLSMASDFGKLFGWCSGVLLLYFPTWIVLFMAAFLGLFGYGVQWLLIQRFISLPYIMVSNFLSHPAFYLFFPNLILGFRFCFFIALNMKIELCMS